MTDRPAPPEGTRGPAAPVPVASITWEQWHEARSDTKRAVWMSYVVLALVVTHLAATFALYDRVGELGTTVGVLSATVDSLSATVERIDAGQREIVTELADARGRLETVEKDMANISSILADMRADIRRGSLLMPGIQRTVASPWTVERLENYLVARVDTGDMRGLLLFSPADGSWSLATGPDDLFSLRGQPPSASALATVPYANAPSELRSYVEGVLGLPAR